MPFVDETRVAANDSSHLQPSDPDPKTAAFSGDNLVDQPKKVQETQSIPAFKVKVWAAVLLHAWLSCIQAQPLAISYARVAKRIDVKKVKGRMWSLIEASSAEQDVSSTCYWCANLKHHSSKLLITFSCMFITCRVLVACVHLHPFNIFVRMYLKGRVSLCQGISQSPFALCAFCTWQMKRWAVCLPSLILTMYRRYQSAVMWCCLSSSTIGFVYFWTRRHGRLKHSHKPSSITACVEQNGHSVYAFLFMHIHIHTYPAVISVWALLCNNCTNLHK